jgi:uncharacterized phage-associated protein
MKYTALDIARYTVSKCAKDLNAVSNLSLQKILYWIQGEYYRQTGQFLFADDFRAFPYGPVIQKVYDEYQFSGGSPIYGTKIYDNIDGNTAKIIDPVIESKSLIPVYKLVGMTHKKGGAWDLTYQDGSGNIIPKSRIADEFSDKFSDKFSDGTAVESISKMR